MNNVHDIQLLEHIRADNRSAFTELVNRYTPILFRFIYKRTSSTEDTQDILQNVFASLWRRRMSIYVEDSLYPYLFKAAKYEIIDLMVKRQQYIERSAVLLAREVTASFVYSGEDDFIAKELDDLIDQEVAGMPATMKNAFTLSRRHALSIKDIASELSLSEQTVKNNISLALNKLRMKFK